MHPLRHARARSGRDGVPFSLELTLDARKMAVHRRTRGVAVVRGERRDDGFMVGERLFAQRRRVKMLLDSGPQLTAPLFPQRRHDERKRAVAGGLGNADMEVAVRCVALLEIAAVRAHAGDGLAQRGNLRLANAARGECRDFALDEPARGKELEWTGALVVAVRRGVRALARCRGRARGLPANKNAGADAYFDASGDFERDQSFAHRRPRHPQQHGELAFGRQARTSRELAAVDQHGDLARDLPVKPDGFDDLQRHDRNPRGKAALVCREACLLDGAVTAPMRRPMYASARLTVKWSNHRTNDAFAAHPLLGP